MAVWLAWVALAVVLGIVEVTTLSLVFAMLAGGALVGALAALLGATPPVQVLVALASAVALLAVVRPIALKHIRMPLESRTGVAALVGAQGLVLEQVTAHGGRIKLGGEVWSARTLDPHHIIEPGSTVDVVQIDGATAVVYESEIR
jgi:membrane protein implicated in regulation of membrane protease activity